MMAAPMPPPIPVRTETLWKRVGLAFLLAMATAAGGALFAGATQWTFGIASRGYVDTQIAAAVAPVETLQKRFDERAEEILTEVRIGNTRQLERVGVMIRERVGLRAALNAGLDPKRKSAADRASAVARAKYDELMLRPNMTAEDAETRVYEFVGVPR